MKKIFYALLIISFGLVLAGCSKNKEGEIPNPVSDPGGYLPDMVKMKKTMEGDINRGVEKENQRINDALKDSGLNE